MQDRRQRLDGMDLTRLKWLNGEFAKPARRLSKIKSRIDSRGYGQDDPIYAALATALQALYTACEITHQELQRRRPPLENPYKPSSGKVTRLTAEEQLRLRQALEERGRAGPPPSEPLEQDRPNEGEYAGQPY